MFGRVLAACCAHGSRSKQGWPGVRGCPRGSGALPRMGEGGLCAAAGVPWSLLKGAGEARLWVPEEGGGGGGGQSCWQISGRGAAPGQAISPSRHGPPPRIQLWGRRGDCSLAWEVRAAFRVPGHGRSRPPHHTEDPSLLCSSRPEILLQLPLSGLFESPQSR